MRRRFSSPGAQSAPVAEARPPQGGHLDEELRSAAEQRPQGPAESDRFRRETRAPEAEAPEHGDHVEHGGGECREAEALLGIEHAHGDRRERHERQERHHHAGQEDGQLRLARHRGIAGREQGHERTREDHTQEHQDRHDDREEGEDPAGQSMRGLASAVVERLGVGRDEGRRERALGEEVPQEIGDAEGHVEGVGVEAGAQERREHDLSRTRPSRRDTRVRAETSPVARRAREVSPSFLTSLKALGRLVFCPM